MERMRAEARCERARHAGWPGLEPVHGVVATPLHHLQSVDRRIDPGERNVENGHAPSCPTQVAPERCAREELPCRGPTELVRAALELNRVVESVARRREAGAEGWPGRAHEESVETARLPHEAASEQRADMREGPVLGPADQEGGVRRVNRQDEHLSPGHRSRSQTFHAAWSSLSVKRRWCQPVGSRSDWRCQRHACFNSPSRRYLAAML